MNWASRGNDHASRDTPVTRPGPRRAVRFPARRLPALATCIGIVASFILPAGFITPWFSDPGALFRALDYEGFPALGPVQQHYTAGRIDAAKVALHEYLTTRDTRPLHVFAGNLGAKAEADNIVNRIFTIQGKTFQINDSGNLTVNGRNVYNVKFHRNPDPDGDNEWIWLFNRGGAWMNALARVARGYLDAGNVSMGEYYAGALVDIFTLFLQNEPVGSSFSWRTIDSAIRIGNMLPSFDAIRDSEAFTPAFCFEYLSSLLQHGTFLFNYHKTRTNWAWIEANHLVMLAAYLPELLPSTTWLDECWAMLGRLVQESVYPDGGTNEQSMEYHMVMLGQLLDVLEYARYFPRVQAPAHLDLIGTRMGIFLVHNTMPDWRCTTYGHADVRDTRGRIGKTARVLPGRHPDIDYFDANGNPNVTRPAPRLNVGFPDTGVFVSRSAWNDPMALYSFFDGSPYGFGYHQNDDVLNVMLYGYGRRLVIDPGRYSYLTDDMSMYLRSAHAHNTVLIDGKGLFGVGATSTAWAAGRLGSSARARHSGFGAMMERELTFVNFRADPAGIPVNQSTTADAARYWLVSDFWHGTGQHEAWVHWQLPAHQPVLASSGPGHHAMTTDFASGNLATFAFGPWTRVENITGGDPAVHGKPYGHWSPEYNALEQATTYRFIGNTIGPSSWFTVLYPYGNGFSMDVAPVPHAVGSTTYDVNVHARPANVFAVTFPDGSVNLHVTMRQGHDPDIPIAFTYGGHDWVVRGTQASFHIPPGQSSPSQVLARSLRSLHIDGATWIAVEGSTITIDGGDLVYLSLGMDPCDGACTVIVNGTTLPQGNHSWEENCINVNLLG